MRAIKGYAAVAVVVGAVVLMLRPWGPPRDRSTATGNGSAGMPPVEVRFSPRGGCTELIVAELAAARQSVLIQAYKLTSSAIAKAVLAAHRRGVDVRVILDSSQQTDKYSASDFLSRAGITTLIDAEHGIAHNKVIIIDGQTVITGSFNFSRAAEEENAENLLVIRDGPLAAKYTANWEAHQRHSRPYQRLAAPVKKR